MSYLRWRHSHGFGIHSPFAYELVKTALSPGIYGFYGYDLIDDALIPFESRLSGKELRRLRNDARLLLRLLYALSSSRLAVPLPPDPITEAAAVGAGVPIMDIADAGPGDLALSSDIKSAVALLNKGVAVFFAGDTTHARTALADARPVLADALAGHGLLLYGNRHILAVPRPEMAFVEYSVFL